MSDDLRNELARTLALAGDEDGCFVRIDEWEAQEEWEREAHPDEYPASDHEDAAYWRRKADALMPIIERVKAEAKAEVLEEAAQDICLTPVAEWKRHGNSGIRENAEADASAWLDAQATAIRAAAENGESNEVAKITENRNEWASRMMELATTEQKLEEAERRIAAVVAEANAIRAAFIEFWGAHSSADIVRVGRSPRMPETPAIDREHAALHPVAETTEKGNDDE